MRVYPDKKPQEEFDTLRAAGYKGTINDMQDSFLSDLEYKGSLADKIYSYLTFSSASPDTTGLSLAPDYWIDATNGNDSNDGSESSPWASLNKIEGLSGDGGDTVVRVKSDTYDTTSDHFEINGFDGHLRVVFEDSCVMDGAVHGTSAQNPIYIGNSPTIATLYLNGLEVKNFDGSDGGSPNGIGYGGAGVELTVFGGGAVVENCQDGISGHTSGHADIYEVTFRGHKKWQCANIDVSTMNAYRCRFEASPSGGFGSNGSGLQYFEDCELLCPTGSGSRAFAGDFMRFKGCLLGDLTTPIDIKPAGVNSADEITISEGFVNLDIQAWDNISILKNYGKLRARQRNGSESFEVKRNIISQSSAVIYSNNDFGGSNKHLVHNNIFTGMSEVTDFYGNMDDQVVAAQSEYFNNVVDTTTGTSIGANLVAADVGGSVVVATVSADPLIGSADSLDPDDYGYAPGSPAIGAATDGGNCGFAVGEL